MFNLLPKEDKEAIRKEYRYRLAIVFCAGLLLTFIVGCVLLLPSYFLSRVKESTIAKNIVILQETASSGEGAKFVAELTDAKETVSALEPDDNQIYFHEMFRNIIETRSGGIALTAMAMQSSSLKDKEFIISGVAKTRSDLVSFVKQLQGEKVFQSVELPLSNYTKESDIGFTLTIKARLP